jgi:hypothetical protein
MAIDCGRCVRVTRVGEGLAGKEVLDGREVLDCMDGREVLAGRAVLEGKAVSEVSVGMGEELPINGNPIIASRP